MNPLVRTTNNRISNGSLGYLHAWLLLFFSVTRWASQSIELPITYTQMCSSSAYWISFASFFVGTVFPRGQRNILLYASVRWRNNQSNKRAQLIDDIELPGKYWTIWVNVWVPFVIIKRGEFCRSFIS